MAEQGKSKRDLIWEQKLKQREERAKMSKALYNELY